MDVYYTDDQLSVHGSNCTRAYARTDIDLEVLADLRLQVASAAGLRFPSEYYHLISHPGGRHIVDVLATSPTSASVEVEADHLSGWGFGDTKPLPQLVQFLDTIQAFLDRKPSGEYLRYCPDDLDAVRAFLDGHPDKPLPVDLFLQATSLWQSSLDMLRLLVSRRPSEVPFQKCAEAAIKGGTGLRCLQVLLDVPEASGKFEYDKLARAALRAADFEVLAAIGASSCADDALKSLCVSVCKLCE